jgi:hypothetical protein
MERFMRKRGKKMPRNPELDEAVRKRKIRSSGVGNLGGEEVESHKIKSGAEIEEENVKKLEELKRKFGIE